jgi:hypothetical protein
MVIKFFLEVIFKYGQFNFRRQIKIYPGIGILHNRGHRCVYSATDEVLDSLSTKASN